MSMMDRKTFLNLPAGEVARLVREVGPQVCVFPINGTRRWFILQHGAEAKSGSVDDYLEIAGKQHIRVYKLCIEHGLDTLLTPVFGSELLTRGDEYTRKIGAEGMARLASHPDFLSFYQDYSVRVRFYGDHHQHLAGTPFAYLSDLFDNVTKLTIRNNGPRLFFGVFANDATETVAALSVRHFQKTGNIPGRKELVEQYYGEYVSPATLFIGFDKFNIFDYPLLSLGEEDLYFTVSPSLYLNDVQLLDILYDHIFLRPAQELDYAKISVSEFRFMRNFYDTNRESTFGIGEVHGGIWYSKSPFQK